MKRVLLLTVLAIKDFRALMTGNMLYCTIPGKPGDQSFVANLSGGPKLLARTSRGFCYKEIPLSNGEILLLRTVESKEKKIRSFFYVEKGKIYRAKVQKASVRTWLAHLWRASSFVMLYSLV